MTTSYISQLRRMAAHLRWADLKLLDRLRTSSEPDAIRLMAHVVGAGRVWLTRLDGEDSSHLPIWPEWNLDQISAEAEAVHDDLEEYLRRLDEALLPEPIVYRNQTGKEFSTARGDVLTHLLMHGGYHRGQIARALRQAGHEPVNTDYITWVRETTA